MISLFETRTMLTMLAQLYPPKTFLLDTFFPTVETSLSEDIDIDVYKGKRRLAPFVNFTSQGKVVERLGFETRTFKPAYIKMKMKSGVEEILRRAAGSIIYQGDSSPAERASQQMAEDLAELQDMITRREEWMASQALEAGKIVVKGEGYDATIDFLMDASHIITLVGADLWTDAGSKPIDKLRDYFDKIGEDSGLNPDVCIMGRDAANAFLSHQDVRELLDNRRIEMGQIDPRLLPNGAIFLGTLKDPAVDVYRYNEFYFDDGSGTTKPMVPLNKIFMGSTKARTARHYGLIKDLDAGDASVRWFPKTWIDPDPSVRWLLLQSAPIVAMHQADAFIVSKVV